jgi:hypothetical protein
MERGSKRKRLRAPSPAMVVACIALAVTLSGASYAATSLARNSVGTAQLKANAVTGAKVANGSLTRADLSAGTISDFTAATGDPDSFVASGGNWIDADSAGRSTVQVSDGSQTQWCSITGSTTGSNPGAFQAIHLPQGAKMTRMVVDYRDDPGSTLSNGTVSMVRMPLFNSTGTLNEIFSVTLSNLGSGIPLTANDNTPGGTTPIIATIDNTRYSYALLATPTPPLANVGLCNVRVMFTHP